MARTAKDTSGLLGAVTAAGSGGNSGQGSGNSGGNGANTGIDVILEQANYELKLGDPEVDQDLVVPVIAFHKCSICLAMFSRELWPISCEEWQ